LHIVTDSKYLVDGLTRRLPAWERKGWLNIANATELQDLVARLRERSAVTTLRWVKGHSGIPGNEGADKLATLGAEKDAPVPLRQAPVDFLRKGASLRWITQRLAYKGIRNSKAKEEREASARMIAQVQASLQDVLGTSPTSGRIWKSIRHKDIPRKMRDFWWKALHNALRVGHYWSHITGYEMRANCMICGSEESLEHILLECDAPGQRCIWREVDNALARANIPPRHRSLGTVLGAPATQPLDTTAGSAKGQQRLRKILEMEATHLIWKIRCERVIQHDGDPDRWPHERAVRNRWWQVLNRRLRIDQGLTARRLDKRALERQLVLDTWNPIIVRRSDLPDDWIGKPGILVGTPEDSDGVG
ncbi:RnaseH-domain-containing protein, partial [Lentinus brumalis]